jgi:hypothetical protein
VVDYNPSTEVLDITDTDYTGTYGDYELMITFFADYPPVDIYEMPTHMTDDFVSISVSVDTGIADIGAVTLSETRQEEPVIAFTGTINLSETIEAEYGSAFAILLLPEDWTFETAEETGGPTEEHWIEGEPGNYALLFVFINFAVGDDPTHGYLMEEIAVSHVPSSVDFGTVTLVPFE